MATLVIPVLQIVTSLSRTVLVAATVTTTRAPAYTCYQFPRTNLPDWFVTSVLAPYERLYCLTPTIYVLNQTRYAIIDRATGAQDDYRKVCSGWFGLVFYRSLGTFYRATGALDKSAALLGYGFFYGINDYLLIALYLILFIAPLAFASQSFALYVVRRVLQQTDSYLYVYHVTLVIISICLYLVSAGTALSFNGFVFLPCCLLSEAIAIQFENYQTAQSNTMLVSLFTFGSWVHGVHVLDRLLSICAPSTHYRHASAKVAVYIIVAIFVCNGILTLVEFTACTAYYQAFYDNGVIAAGYSGNLSVALVAADRVRVAAAYVRLVVLIAATLLQLVCCGVLFFKVRRIRRGQTSSEHNQVSLLPCYLNAGTCGANLCASVMELLNLSGEILGWPVILKGSSLLVPIMYTRYITTTGFSCIALYVHCALSRLFRQEVCNVLAHALHLCRICCPKVHVAAIDNAAENETMVMQTPNPQDKLTEVETLRKRSLSSRGQSPAETQI